jgi:hypothetical protein
MEVGWFNGSRAMRTRYCKSRNLVRFNSIINGRNKYLMSHVVGELKIMAREPRIKMENKVTI